MTDHGHAVREGGELHHLSASSLNTAACLRKWFFHYVMKWKQPEIRPQALGKAVHDSIDHYYKTGEEALHNLAMHARPFIPDRTGIMQWSEHELNDFWILPGVMFVGAIDLYHWAPKYKLPSGEWESNTQSVFELVDWKTSSDPAKWGLQGHDFITTNQMPAYAKYHFDLFEHELVRVSHVYMKTRGAPFSMKTTTVLEREAVFRRWDEMTGVARTLRDVARETDADKVPINEEICTRFGGCPYREKCNRPANTLEKSLESSFGITKADELRGRQTKMANVEDEIEKLKQEQAAAQGAPDIDVKADWETIIAADMGTPPLTADAAQALAKVMGWDIPQGGYAGCGDTAKGHKLHQLPPLTLQSLHTVAKNLRDAKKAPEPEAAPPPPAAPVQAAPTAPQPPAPPTEPPAPPTPPAEPSEAWGAPEVDLSVYKEPAKDSKAYPEDMDDNLEKVIRHYKTGEKPTPKKPQLVAAFKELLASYERDCGTGPREPMGDTEAYEKGYTDGQNSVQADNMPDGYVLYIDCIPSGPYDLLDEYIANAMAEICKQFGERDIRSAQHEDLNFGRWKGVLSSFVRECPPPDGKYFISTGDEIGQVVAAELARGACRYARGVR